MSESSTRSDKDWPVTWKANHQAQREDALASTPAERLAWLEEALELVEAAERARRERERSESR